MSVQSVEIKTSNKESESKIAPPSNGMAHRFKNPTEFITVKVPERGANMSRILQVINSPSLGIVEQCNGGSTCLAPREVHIMAARAA